MSNDSENIDKLIESQGVTLALIRELVKQCKELELRVRKLEKKLLAN